MIQFKHLSLETIDDYLLYFHKANHLESDLMTTDHIDRSDLEKRLKDPSFQFSTSILAYDEDEIVGRLEYQTYGCMQDGYHMAYVNWVYVLKEYRRNGIARSLFKEFEKECIQKGIDEYFLLEACNPQAKAFYQSFSNASQTNMMVLRKTIKDEF